MITFDPLWETLKKKGLSKNKFRKMAGKGSSLITRLNHNKPINLNTLDDICNALDCNVEDIIKFTKDVDKA